MRWFWARQLKRAAGVGCRFALSPVCPGTLGSFDFVSECHKRGMVAVPAAFTPQVQQRTHTGDNTPLL